MILLSMHMIEISQCDNILPFLFQVHKIWIKSFEYCLELRHLLVEYLASY